MLRSRLFRLALVIGWLSSTARGAVAEPVGSLPPLVWGADQEGGGPYIFPKPEDPSVVVGFEVDLAEELGRRLGRAMVFQQAQWESLPSMLAARKVDLILNGYEWMPERVRVMAASIPYYVYGLQLEVEDGGPITTWAQLERPHPDGRRWQIGVLGGSAAQAHVESLAARGHAIEHVSYDGVTDAMRDVETGKLDATLQDTPIAAFYQGQFPHLRFVGEPVAPGYYVAYGRKDDQGLMTDVNAALIGMIRDGSLARIYGRYRMWSAAQGELATIADHGRFYGALAAMEETPTPGRAEADPSAPAVPAVPAERDKLLGYLLILLASAAMTVALAVLSFPLAVGLGVSLALGRMYGPRWLRALLTGVVEFLRGTPLMLQLYFIFFFLPEVGLVIPAFPTAILGLAINYSAYESEIYRAGLQAIPTGQMEAALALGMSRRQALGRIVVPQAFRIVIPPMVNDFIAMFKDTSVCSVVTIVELTKRFSVLSRNNVADLVVLMGMTALLYLAMSYPMSLLARQVERRLGVGGGRP